MNHLVGLDFENFQSLKDTKIELHPGFNVIVGPSNLGKSAALRALRALMRNASAPGLIREGASQMTITAWFDDGQKVSLIKGKNKSEFNVNDTVYAKSGATAVPDAVDELWSVASPDGRELSYTTQHETPFLLAEPPSAVAKVLGDLTNANLLLEAVQRANKMRTEALADEKARTREAEEARSEILTHKGLTARTKAVEAARELHSAAVEAQSKLDELTYIEQAYEYLNTELALAEKILRDATDVSDLVKKLDAAVADFETLQKLELYRDGLEAQFIDAQVEVDALELLLEQNDKQIHILLEEAGSCPLCGSTI